MAIHWKKKARLAVRLAVFGLILPSLLVVTVVASWRSGARRVARGVVKRSGPNVLFFQEAEGESEPLRIANAAELPPADIPLIIEGKVTKSTSTIAVEDVQSKLVADWRQGSPRNNLLEINRAVDEADASFRSFRTGKAPRLWAGDYLAALANVEETIGSELQRGTPGTTSDSAVLTAAKNVVQEQQILKAQYHEFLAVYTPSSYEAINERSKGVAAIGKTGQNPLGTGVLVGTDLILTCNHCIGDDRPQDLEFRFNYEVDLSGNARAVEIYSLDVDSPLADRGIVLRDQEMDFALVRVKPVHGTTPAGKQWPVQTLSGEDVPLGHPIYVIGHPEGLPRAVADNAHVVFPSKASKADFAKISARVAAQYGSRSDFVKIFTDFTNSYVKGPGDVFQYRHDGRLTIGADCDTFHGNSGSPVFSRRSHRVIGLLYAGEPDVVDAYTPGWRYHELISPIGPVISAIQRRLPDWAQHGMLLH